jgi:hypothetical protein
MARRGGAGAVLDLTIAFRTIQNPSRPRAGGVLFFDGEPAMEEDEADTEGRRSASAGEAIGDGPSIRGARVRLATLLAGLVSRGIA